MAEAKKTKEVTASDVMSWLKGQTATMPILGLVMGTIWLTFAQPKVESSIDTKLKPVIERVVILEREVKFISFDTKQLLSLLTKIAGDSLVREMERETEIFKPKGYVR